MVYFDAKRLPNEFPRCFVPKNIDLGDWTQVKPILLSLKHTQLRTQKQIEDWVLKRSEIEACLHQEGNVRYIRMTQQINNQEYKRLFLDYVENIERRMKEFTYYLDCHYVNSKALSELSRTRYFILNRKIRSNILVFCKKNLSLQVEEEKMIQNYLQIMTNINLHFQGKNLSLEHLNKYMENPERSVREKFWIRISEKVLEHKESIEDIFNRLLKIRHIQSRNAGYKDYREYAFLKYGRYDYDLQLCSTFQKAVEKCILPLVKKLNREMARKIGLKKLRPWDVNIDFENQESYPIFSNSNYIVEIVSDIFKRMDSGLSSYFEKLRKLNLMDIDIRKGKSPGCYNAVLHEVRLPFILMNITGCHKDVVSLLHESGHALHAFFCRQEELFSYRCAPSEFSELAAKGIEMMSFHYRDTIYPRKVLKQVHINSISHIFHSLVQGAMVDAFEQWIYAHPEHSNEERKRYWFYLCKRFNTGIDYDSLETFVTYKWLRILHVFVAPFYYISYGLSQIGALQLCQNMHKQPERTIEQYKYALSLGGSKSLRVLFKSAGLKFDFGLKTVKELTSCLKEQLD